MKTRLNKARKKMVKKNKKKSVKKSRKNNGYRTKSGHHLMEVQDWKKEVGINGDDPKANRACLDVELARTPTGAKVCTALKGAVDGELDVSYSEKRFLG